MSSTIVKECCRDLMRLARFAAAGVFVPATDLVDIARRLLGLPEGARPGEVRDACREVPDDG